jgi:Fe2+ or Zn2+ uptake regulation protein
MSVRTTQNEDQDPALTPQRHAVLRVIRAIEQHMTAAEIFEADRKVLPTISYATVYNSLRYLKDAGLVSEICFGNGASRFDRETARHDHAICTRCTRLVDFDLPATLKFLPEAARRSGFKPESLHLTLLGLCPGCREGD